MSLGNAFSVLSEGWMTGAGQSSATLVSDHSLEYNSVIFKHYQYCTIKRWTDSTTDINTLGEQTKTIATIATNVKCDIQDPVPIPFFVGFAGVKQQDPPGEYQLKVPQIFFEGKIVDGNGIDVTVLVNDIIIDENSRQYELLELYDWATHYVGTLRKIN